MSPDFCLWGSSLYLQRLNSVSRCAAPGCQIVSKCVPHSGTRLRRRQRPEISWYNTRGQSVTDLSSLWRPDNSLRDSQIEADTKWPALDYVMISCLLICLYILNYKRLCLCVHHFWFKCPQPVQWHWIKHLNTPSQGSDTKLNITPSQGSGIDLNI